MRFVQDVSDLNRLFCRQCASESGRWRWSYYWILTPLFDIRLRCTMHCNNPKGISFASI